MSPEFLAYHRDAGLSCLESSKRQHWQTWLAARESLLAELLKTDGPVTMITLADPSEDE